MACITRRRDNLGGRAARFDDRNATVMAASARTGGCNRTIVRTWSISRRSSMLQNHFDLTVPMIGFEDYRTLCTPITLQALLALIEALMADDAKGPTVIR